jgi:hypothetical protein
MQGVDPKFLRNLKFSKKHNKNVPKIVKPAVQAKVAAVKTAKK